CGRGERGGLPAGGGALEGVGAADLCAGRVAGAGVGEALDGAGDDPRAVLGCIELEAEKAAGDLRPVLLHRGDLLIGAAVGEPLAGGGIDEGVIDRGADGAAGVGGEQAPVIGGVGAEPREVLGDGDAGGAGADVGVGDRHGGAGVRGAVGGAPLEVVGGICAAGVDGGGEIGLGGGQVGGAQRLDRRRRR